MWSFTWVKYQKVNIFNGFLFKYTLDTGKASKLLMCFFTKITLNFDDFMLFFKIKFTIQISYYFHFWSMLKSFQNEISSYFGQFTLKSWGKKSSKEAGVLILCAKMNICHIYYMVSKINFWITKRICISNPCCKNQN